MTKNLDLLSLTVRHDKLHACCSSKSSCALTKHLLKNLTANCQEVKKIKGLKLILLTLPPLWQRFAWNDFYSYLKAWMTKHCLSKCFVLSAVEASAIKQHLPWLRSQHRDLRREYCWLLSQEELDIPEGNCPSFSAKQMVNEGHLSYVVIVDIGRNNKKVASWSSKSPSKTRLFSACKSG